jgi:ferredoxin
MDAVRSEYERAGALERFHQEAFTPPVLDAGPTGGIVRFTASGTDATNDGRPLLDQAEAAGLAPRHGCRMGVCHTCTRTLHSGTVRNAITGVVTSDPGVEIQVCVNVPVGDVDIDL